MHVSNGLTVMRNKTFFVVHLVEKTERGMRNVDKPQIGYRNFVATKRATLIHHIQLRSSIFHYERRRVSWRGRAVKSGGIYSGSLLSR